MNASDCAKATSEALIGSKLNNDFGVLKEKQEKKVEEEEEIKVGLIFFVFL